LVLAKDKVTQCIDLVSGFLLNDLGVT